MRMDVNNNPDISFPAAQVIVIAAGRRADRARNAGHAADRGGGARHQRRRRDSAPTSARAVRSTIVQFAIGTPVDRARQRCARRGVADPQRPARRHPRAAGRARRHRRRADRLFLGRGGRHDARAAELVRRQHRRQAAARRSQGMAQVQRGGGVSREIRVILDPAKMQAQGITAARSTRSCARSTSTPPAAAPRSPAPSSRCACSAMPTDAYALGQKQISVGNGRTVKLADIADGARSLCRAALARQDERPAGAELQHRARPRALPTSPSTTRR